MAALRLAKFSQFPVERKDWRSPGGCAGTRVVGQIMEEGRAKKILVFHYKRKKQYKKLRGHRQAFSAVRILKSLSTGRSSLLPNCRKRRRRSRKKSPQSTRE